MFYVFLKIYFMKAVFKLKTYVCVCVCECVYINVCKVKQSHYRPAVAQRVPGS